MIRRLLPLTILTASLAVAQSPTPPKATPAPEVEIPFPAHLPIPPATVLSPEETLKTLQLPPGFKAELVASEPLIQTPVAMQWDGDGRLWVVEMNGYMPNVDGKGEDVTNGRIVVLEDTNGDGQMDKSTVFLDKLVMPRAISLRKGGALIAEPPMVYWCPDKDGDLKADGKEPVIPNYTAGGNPEHMPNGLMLALDNWLYSSKANKRYRFLQDGTLKTESTLFRGQWGITQDDYGRLFYNTNSDQLRGDLIPANYLSRNSNFKNPPGVNVQIVKSQKTFPGRVTPGVNRGYRPNQLREGRLAEFTAACGPLVYRGDLFPEEFRGNSFICETSANLVKRNVHVERDGDVMAKDAYEEKEFLTSTSERFRPVNAYDGPDGAIYVVDMARGVVQHITYVSPWLRRQILERQLELPLTQGRIWRIVPDNAQRRPAPKLEKASTAELVAALSEPNGWTRDTAQRLLVERGGTEAVAALEKLVKEGKQPLGRLHALWTLEGLEKLKAATVSTALGDKEVKVRAEAIQLSESFLEKDRALTGKLLALVTDPAAEVQIQLLATLGQLKSDEATAAMAALITTASENYLARSAAISGLKGRELEFMKRLIELPAWKTESPGKTNLLSLLARCLTEERKTDRVKALLDVAIKTAGEDWQRLAILNGAVGIIPVPEAPAGSIAAEQAKIGAKPQGSNGLGRGFKPITVPSEPAQLAALAKLPSPAVQALAKKESDLFVWTGKPGYVPPPKIPDLTPEQVEFVAAGKQLYVAICAACHQPAGQGQEGLAPPIANSEWATGPDGRLIRIVLQGVGGPMTVNGKEYNLDMPGLGAAFTDEQIAQILSYIRRDLGNLAPVVETATVSKVRDSTKDRGASWTAEELERIH